MLSLEEQEGLTDTLFQALATLVQTISVTTLGMVGAEITNVSQISIKAINSHLLETIMATVMLY